MMKNKIKEQFSLPPGITCTQKIIDNNKYSYVFRHNRLGEIGRLIVLPCSYGSSEWIYEVVGDPDDPMTNKRKEIFDPTARSLIKMSKEMFGEDIANLKPSFITPKETAIIKAEMMPCNKCATTVAAMILASDAYTVDQLEDYARMAFAKIKELNVPTWIVGAEQMVLINGNMVEESLVLKVWPQREPARIIYPMELHRIFSQLKKNHCIN